ncbi:hypothetical protein GCM10023067_01230 [Aminobacter aganoensis]
MTEAISKANVHAHGLVRRDDRDIGFQFGVDAGVHHDRADAPLFFVSLHKRAIEMSMGEPVEIPSSDAVQEPGRRMSARAELLFLAPIPRMVIEREQIGTLETFVARKTIPVRMFKQAKRMKHMSVWR